MDDLLAALFRAKDEESGARMTDEEIYEHVMTFLAGHETTSNALSWTWYLLSQNPHVEEKFHQEIDTVFG
ncbi:hypothetical protein GCM10020331_101810 [Ectobacillus funiculus]